MGFAMNRLQKLLRRRKYRLRRSMYLSHTSGPLALELLDEEELLSSGDEKKSSSEAPSAGEREKPAHTEQTEKLAALEAALEASQEQLRESQDLALRGRADLENQRRRFQKEKEDLRKFAKEELMRELINPMDHFAIALGSLDSATDLESIRKGIAMIHREFMMVLKQSGLSELNPLGDAFDPNLHDAVSTGYDPEQSEGAILAVSRPGWELKGRVLRPAMVQVNRKPVKESPTEPVAPSLEDLSVDGIEYEPGPKDTY